MLTAPLATILSSLFLMAAPAPLDKANPQPRLQELEVKNIDIELQQSARQILDDLEQETLSESSRHATGTTLESYPVPTSDPHRANHERPLK